MSKLRVPICEAGDKICSQLSVPYSFFLRPIINYIKLFEFLEYYGDTFFRVLKAGNCFWQGQEEDNGWK